MGSRTSMKQQIMRQMVMDEEKPHKEISNSTSGNYNNLYKGSYNSISPTSDTLPSLTSTMIGSDKRFPYCKPYINSPNLINYPIDSNNLMGDDFTVFTNDFNESINATDSPYIMSNMYPVENKFSCQSYNNDYSLHSPVLDRNLDSNSYNNQYHNPASKSGHLTQITHDMYGYKTSFSCPVTGDQMTATTNQRRMSNSNSSVLGSPVINYDDKRSQLKDRNKKESHNRIERKRRDFINQQIIELSNLLPSQMMSEGESKKNKGNILKNSVIYIQHLQVESKNTSNYIKETDLAFKLVDGYRKQMHELQQQIRSGSYHNSSSSPLICQNMSDDYNEYITIREQNQRASQMNGQLLLPSNPGTTTPSDILHRGSSSSNIKSPLSSLDIGSAFKIEPSSANSSLGNNSLSNPYRIDEETAFNSLNDTLLPNIMSQNVPHNYRPATPIPNDLYGNSNSHYQGLRMRGLEYMEC